MVAACIKHAAAGNSAWRNVPALVTIRRIVSGGECVMASNACNIGGSAAVAGCRLVGWEGMADLCWPSSRGKGNLSSISSKALCSANGCGIGMWRMCGGGGENLAERRDAIPWRRLVAYIGLASRHLCGLAREGL